MDRTSQRKRAFRTSSNQTQQASYPTLERFDQGRRDFLGRLGALGAALLGGSVLAGCFDRPIPTPEAQEVEPERTPPSSGGAPQPPTRLDLQLAPDAGPDLRPAPDRTPPSPDLPENIAGGAPMPPAPIDLGPGQD